MFVFTRAGWATGIFFLSAALGTNNHSDCPVVWSVWSDRSANATNPFRRGPVAQPERNLEYVWGRFLRLIQLVLFTHYSLGHSFSRLGARSLLAPPLGARSVSFHNFESQNFKLSVSNRKSKYVAYSSVLYQISNFQGLGRTNKLDVLKTDRCACAGGSARDHYYMYIIYSQG